MSDDPIPGQPPMKIQCLCGKQIFLNPDGRDYCWMTGANWSSLLDLIDSEIEQMTDHSKAEDVIMKVRYAALAHSVWRCSDCDRLVTLKEGEPLFLQVEQSIQSD